MFVQQLITGLSVGSIYALMAVGYSLIYSLLNFTNFAHSASVLIGAYAGYYYITLVVDHPLAAALCALALGALLAALIERVAYQPLLDKGAKRIYLLIAGLGISIIGENLIVVLIDGRFHAYKTSLSSMPLSIFGASIGVIDLIILVASAVALLLVQFLIQKTKVGLAIRGAAFDLTTASIMGINVRRLILIVFIIAGSLAGLSGVFLGIKYTAYPTMGNLTNKAFISAVVGGLGSLPGAVAGALILGVLETMISAYVSSAMRNLFAYALLIVILLIRPWGLMGKSVEDKA
ncbi:MAG: branched-chain amino acid ABC transporter permease [Oscillospiraceae bacterium]|nr:branched-chain amino acid ABC transporter permease [Oscillospiraceae bacterium]